MKPHREKILFILNSCFFYLCSIAQTPQPTDTLFFSLSDTVFVKNSKLICDDIIFEPASIFIQKKSEPYLDSIAGIMLHHPGMKICITYTQYDWPEQARSNYSFDRVGFIAEYLASKGIEMNRLLRKAMTYKTEEDAALNKRKPGKHYTVEFRIIAL